MTVRPQPGDWLGGRYRVECPVAMGMTSVFEASDTLTGRRVALRWVRSLRPDRDATKRLLRETQIASNARHPNLVEVYDVFEDDERVFVVRELLEGEPLDAALSRGELPLSSFLALAIEAMRAVAAANAQHFLHGGIDPSKIFLARSGCGERGVVVKVLDLAIARLEQLELAPTQHDVVAGVPAYMAFEQLVRDGFVSESVDVYAFGVILYRAMTGQLPHPANNLTELIVARATSEPVAIRTLRPEIPAPLAEAVMAALARSALDRTRSLDLLIAQLEPFARGPSDGDESARHGADVLRISAPRQHGYATRAAALAPSGAPDLAPPRRTRRLLFALAAVAVIVLGAVRALA